MAAGHPRFFNQLSTGLDIVGLAGEWLTSTANTNMWVHWRIQYFFKIPALYNQR